MVSRDKRAAKYLRYKTSLGAIQRSMQCYYMNDKIIYNIPMYNIFTRVRPSKRPVGSITWITVVYCQSITSVSKYTVVVSWYSYCY